MSAFGAFGNCREMDGRRKTGSRSQNRDGEGFLSLNNVGVLRVLGSSLWLNWLEGACLIPRRVPTPGTRAKARVCLGFAKFDHFVLLMAGFLDFCGDFFAANCANDANGRPIRVIRAIRGSDFGCG